MALLPQHPAAQSKNSRSSLENIFYMLNHLI